MIASPITITNKNSEALLMVNDMIIYLDREANKYNAERRDKRYLLDTKIVLGDRLKNNRFKPLYEAWGINISNTGIGMITLEAFDSGKHLYVAMPLAGQKKIVFVRVTVKRCDKLTTDMYRIGTIFKFDDEKDDPIHSMLS